MTDKDQPQLDPERQSRARRYARLQRRLTVLELFAGVLYLALWLWAGWALNIQAALSTRSAGGVLPFNPHWTIQLLLFAAVLGLPWYALTLPLSYYSGFVLPHRFGLSTQTLRGWISDQLKGGLLSAGLGIPLLLGLYALMRGLPGLWWVVAAGAYSLVSVVLTALAPVLLMPIFFHFEPLDERYAALADRLKALAARHGTRVEGVYSMDMSRRTVAANAALVGLGRTRRIVLGDTLLENFSPDEIETVLAHELGHHVHRDIPLGILIQSGLNFALFYLAASGLGWTASWLALQGVFSPAGLPALALLFGFFGLITMPFSNAYSRWRERMADRFALQSTRLPKAFARAMTRLANQNLADADPPRWVLLLFGSHPPLRSRIEAAHRFEQAVEV
jgi:STE24 endopeptidase